jgi:cell division protease FtsH
MKNNKNFVTWLIIITVLIMIYDVLDNSGGAKSRLAFSDFLQHVDNNEVREVTMRGNSIQGALSDGRVFYTLAPDYPGLIAELHNKGVRIEVVPLETSMGNLFALLLSWFPILLLIGVWVYFMKNMQSGGGRAMGFGKTKARLISDAQNRVTFNDVAGVDEAKEEVTEIVDFLREPAKFRKLGGKIPRGCLLIGPPGTGKTLLAKAIAGEAKVPFFSIAGSDFVEMFVGVGASRVRDTFQQAKEHAPCIVFIDEIDAVGRHRGAGLGGGNDEREQTLNQLLVEMDGFSQNDGVIVIAATNRADVLDPALLRPGRFDRQVHVPLPDVKGREKILAVHAAKVKAIPGLDLSKLARGTPGFSGADLGNLVNEAALISARRNLNIITMDIFEEAKDKVMMGVERKSLSMSAEQRKLVAYHEAGHALVTVSLPASDPIHKATIIPRGGALGMVQRLPEGDRFNETRERLKASIAVAMGGRVAEELIFGYEKVTNGASSDIKAATNIARMMVTKWGMSDVVGPILVGEDREEVFLGHSIGHEKITSPQLVDKIDTEIRRLVDAGYALAKEILTTKNDMLHSIAKHLLEFETLTGDEIIKLVNGEAIRQVERDDNQENTGGKSNNKKRSSIPTTKPDDLVTGEI